MKSLGSVGSEQDDIVGLLCRVVDEIVKLRGGKNIILVGPLFQTAVEGSWMRVVAFPGKDLQVCTLAVEFGILRPSLVTLTEFASVLRSKFWTVQNFDNAVEWSRAAARFWPGTKADKLVEIARGG